jgi:RNA polymerase sigma-70 factor, ECF subfamily
MSMKSERELVDLLKKGDVNAMEPIMQQHKDYVYTLVIQMVKNSSVAEELTQDVFVKIFKKIDTYQEKSKFTTWLYTITYRTCLNYLEKKKIVFNLSDITDDEKNEKSSDYIPDQEFISGISEIEENEKKRIIWNAIDSIPEQQGVVIALHYLQQFSIKEIADMMEVPDNTIKTHLFRGRNAIRLNLEKFFSREELL